MLNFANIAEKDCNKSSLTTTYFAKRFFHNLSHQNGNLKKSGCMQFYFALQYRILNRRIAAFGLPPFLGYLLGSGIFLGVSVFLFIKTEFAPYIYAFIALTLLFPFNESGRKDFLKLCFEEEQFWKIRLIENLVYVTPFFLFLVYQSSFMVAAALLCSACLLVVNTQNTSFAFTIPTPFGKQPFEFVVGFRKTFYAFFFAAFLIFMAISVGNFNLGIFAILLAFFCCISFYFEPETQYFVWIFAQSPKVFLFQKIKTALLFSTFSTLPLSLALLFFFPSQMLIIVATQCLGYLYLIAVLLAKYAAFPRQISLPQAIILVFGIWLPPLILAVIPYFYFQIMGKRTLAILE